MNVPHDIAGKIIARSAILCLAAPLHIAGLLAQEPQAGGQDPDGSVYTLSPFQVTAEDEGLRSGTSISASIIEMPLIDLPIPVHVLSSEMIEDRAFDDLSDFLVALPGVSQRGTELVDTNVLIRGFVAPSLKDGINLPGAPADAATLERVEVAKGPTAVLYGSGSTGGALNRISKRPKYEHGGYLSLGLGTRDYSKALLDVYGPLDALGLDDFAFRLVAHHLDYETQIDFHRESKTTVMPSLSWRPSERFSLNLRYERVVDDRVPPVEVDIVDTGDPDIGFVHAKDPTGFGYTFSIMGPDAFLTSTTHLFSADFTYFLADSLTLNGIFMEFDQSYDQLRVRDLPKWAETGVARLQGFKRFRNSQPYKLNLLWEVDSGEISNRFVFGYDHEEGDDRWWTQRIGQYVPEPDFSITEESIRVLESQPKGPNVSAESETDGFRFNHYLSAFDDRLHALWGVRFLDNHSVDRMTGNEADFSDETYQAGAIYQVAEGLNVFANFATDVIPNDVPGSNVVDRDGNLITTPQEGEGYDIGIKMDAFDGRVTGMLTYFQTERSNIPRRRDIADDPSTPEDEQFSFFVLSGLEESTGIEFEVVWDITDNWQLLFNGTFMDAEIVSNEADPIFEGTTPQDIVEDSLNFHTIYRFEEGIMKGVEIGGGGYWHDESHTEGNYERRNVVTDDHYIVDFWIKKRVRLNEKDLTLALNVDNLFDKEEYVKKQEVFGPDRRVRLSARMDF